MKRELHIHECVEIPARTRKKKSYKDEEEKQITRSVLSNLRSVHQETKDFECRKRVALHQRGESLWCQSAVVNLNDSEKRKRSNSQKSEILRSVWTERRRSRKADQLQIRFNFFQQLGLFLRRQRGPHRLDHQLFCDGGVGSIETPDRDRERESGKD
jgi:hypothetical protein